MSVLLLDQGYLNEALAHQRKALAGYREAGSPREMLALGNKAAILTRLRRYGAALAFLEQAEQVDPRAAERPAFRASLLANRAHALHALGRLPEAQACSEEALSLREHAPRGAQARVLCTLAPVVAHTSPQRAYAQARQGLAHAVALESPAAQAFAHFVLGGLAPDRAQRRRHLVQALRLCGNDQLLRTDVISALGQSQDSGFVDAPMSAALEADLEIHEVLRHGQRNTEVHKRMVQTLCHDLRNPLTAMVMSTHAVEAEDPEDVDELLSLVRDQCAAITELLAQLEDTALAMDGQLVTGIGRVDSAVALAAALRRVQPAAQAKDIALTLQGPRWACWRTRPCWRGSWTICCPTP